MNEKPRKGPRRPTWPSAGASKAADAEGDFAPFWNRIPKNEENRGVKRSWSNPGKTGQEKLISSRNSLPSATLARELNKGRVTSLRI